MTDFGINEMLEMQRTLQEKYKDKWDPICPERGKDQLLWMIGEIGEVIDIVKKHGGENASREAEQGWSAGVRKLTRTARCIPKRRRRKKLSASRQFPIHTGITAGREKCWSGSAHPYDNRRNGSFFR